MGVRKREVRWSKAASEDLWSILEFMARDRPLVAERLLHRIRARAETLRYTAQKGRRVPELASQGILDYHEIIISVWRLMYKGTPRTVDVLLLIDSRRNIEDVLLMRLARVS